jgi:hypothetical protein
MIFRTPKTPGVTAAVWEEVLHGGLVSVCFTAKLYGMWDVETARRMMDLRQWAADPLLGQQPMSFSVER